MNMWHFVAVMAVLIGALNTVALVFLSSAIRNMSNATRISVNMSAEVQEALAAMLNGDSEPTNWEDGPE